MKSAFFSVLTIKKWAANFRSDCKFSEDDLGEGRLRMTNTIEYIEVDNMILDDRRVKEYKKQGQYD